jgi:acetyltransferase-like isoleucine patch superfamily enzyme
MTKPKDKTKKSSGSIKSIFIPIIAFLVFSLCLFPIVLAGKILLYFIAFDKFWHFLLLPFILYIGIAIVVVSLLLISGGIIRLFNIRYKPGVYEYNFKNKNSFRWVVVCSLYTPCRKILEMFPMGRIKNVYYKLLGMKIGKNTLVGGVIKDPCVTEFGDNTTMGEYAVIYGHIHNYEKETIAIDKVTIGNNCVIGAGSIVMPGAVIQDNVTVAAGALVTKNQVLLKGKTYGGVPAKEIKKKTK